MKKIVMMVLGVICLGAYGGLSTCTNKCFIISSTSMPEYKDAVYVPDNSRVQYATNMWYRNVRVEPQMILSWTGAGYSDKKVKWSASIPSTGEQFCMATNATYITLVSVIDTNRWFCIGKIDCYDYHVKEYNDEIGWETWPTRVNWWECDDIMTSCENLHKVILQQHFRRDNDYVWSHRSDSDVILFVGLPFASDKAIWSKYDKKGTLVKVAQANKFDEYVFLTNAAANVLHERQVKWAEQHKMSYENANNGYEQYIGPQRDKDHQKINIGSPAHGLGSLRQRRLQREKERVQHENEREEQRAQMMQIQKELRELREQRGLDKKGNE